MTKWSLATQAANCIQQFPGIAEGRTRDIDTNPNLILRCVKSPWVNVETRLFPSTFTSNSLYHHTNPPPKTSLLLFALRVTLVFKEYHIECYHDQLLPDSIVLAIVSVKTNNVGFGKWSRVIWYIGILPKFCYLILVNGQFSWILSCCFFVKNQKWYGMSLNIFGCSMPTNKTYHARTNSSLTEIPNEKHRDNDKLHEVARLALSL